MIKQTIKQSGSYSGSGAGRKKKGYFDMDGTSVQFPKDLNKSDIPIQNLREVNATKTIPMRNLRDIGEVGTMSGFTAQSKTREDKKAKTYRKSKSFNF